MEVRGQKTNICGNRNDRQVEFHIVEKLCVITPWQTKQIKKKKKKKKREKKSQSTAREHLLLQRFNSRTNTVMLIRTIANDGSTTDYYFI